MKKFTLFFFIFVVSVCSSNLMASSVTLSAGTDIFKELIKTPAVDSIILAETGVYSWSATYTPALARNLAIIAAKGLSSRPIIEYPASKPSVDFAFLLYKVPASIIEFDGVEFNGNNKAGYLIVSKSSSLGFNITMNNCVVKNLTPQATVGSRSFVFSYSNTATVKVPGFLSVHNSIFEGTGEGVLVCNAGRPDSVNFTNCNFNGHFSAGAISITNGSGEYFRQLVVDHCTFSGNNTADILSYNDASDPKSTTSA